MTESPSAIVGRLGRAQVEQSLRRAARRMGRGRPEPLVLNAIALPDTTVAIEAARVLRAHAPAVLADHSYRTYLFGSALGTRDGLEWDAELLFISAMLHDLGLTDFIGGEGPFEERGATAAETWLRDQGWPEERAAVAAKAIRMHMDVGRAGRQRPEVALLHFGAAADVTGMRLEDIHPRTVEEVIAEYPRAGFKKYFASKVRAEARAHPASITASLCRWGQFAWRIEHSPFSE
jgi:hypothetical protein